jgi:hypothetical protein
MTLKQSPDNLIYIPENEYYTNLKSFGTDEIAALACNTIWSYAGSKLWDKLLTTLAGPVVEKIWFFLTHAYFAYQNYRDTELEKRQNISYYAKQVLNWGWESMIKDILLHDPLYAWLMYAGLTLYPQTPAIIMSFTAFITAVFAVAWIDIAKTYLQFEYFKQQLKDQWFEYEKYLESKIIVESQKSWEQIIRLLQNEFDLGTEKSREYYDWYYQNKLNSFWNRNQQIRRRQRLQWENNTTDLQVIYTKSWEIRPKELSQYRYFATEKEKLHLLFSDENSAEQLQKQSIFSKQVFRKEQTKDIQFTRTYANNPTWLYIAYDQFEHPEWSKHIIELKVHHDKQVLLESLELVLRTVKWSQQFTKSKHLL